MYNILFEKQRIFRLFDKIERNIVSISDKTEMNMYHYFDKTETKGKKCTAKSSRLPTLGKNGNFQIDN